jgi:hypothetical protein
MFTDAFTLAFDERSAVFWFGCWAVLVELLPVGDCAWLLVEAGEFALWVLPVEGELVCAWFEDVGIWSEGWLVWA